MAVAGSSVRPAGGSSDRPRPGRLQVTTNRAVSKHEARPTEARPALDGRPRAGKRTRQLTIAIVAQRHSRADAQAASRIRSSRARARSTAAGSRSPLHAAQRQALAGRGHAQALDRCRDARSPSSGPAHHRLPHLAKVVIATERHADRVKLTATTVTHTQASEVVTV
jgi:hypothetical protein